MHVIGRIGFMGLGSGSVGALIGAPVFAADAPIEDGSKIVITSPKDGDKVGDTFELKYELTSVPRRHTPTCTWTISIRRVSPGRSRA